jgi:hypothetical protein
MKKYNLAITRYFPDKKNNPEWMYLAFEQRKENSEAAAWIV